MKTHDVKLVSDFYDDSASGVKSFEIRKNDRDYQVGDYLNLREVNYSTNINTETASTTGVLIGVDISIRAEAVETGRSHVKEITYILTSEEFPEGIKEGYVILGARPVMSQEEIKAREEMWGWHE